MNNTTEIKPSIKAKNPLEIAASPNDAPTTSLATILAGAGNLPAFNTFAKSCASRMSKFPEI